MYVLDGTTKSWNWNGDKMSVLVLKNGHWVSKSIHAGDKNSPNIRNESILLANFKLIVKKHKIRIYTYSFMPLLVFFKSFKKKLGLSSVPAICALQIHNFRDGRTAYHGLSGPWTSWFSLSHSCIEGDLCHISMLLRAIITRLSWSKSHLSSMTSQKFMYIT